MSNDLIRKIAASAFWRICFPPRRNTLVLWSSRGNGLDPTCSVAFCTIIRKLLEFCFRHSNLLHFAKRREANLPEPCIATQPDSAQRNASWCSKLHEEATWSLLLPICSRGKADQIAARHTVNQSHEEESAKNSRAEKVGANRFLELSLASQHENTAKLSDEVWLLVHAGRVRRDIAQDF